MSRQRSLCKVGELGEAMTGGVRDGGIWRIGRCACKAPTHISIDKNLVMAHMSPVKAATYL